jgi:hypothetical protein
VVYKAGKMKEDVISVFDHHRRRHHHHLERKYMNLKKI